MCVQNDQICIRIQPKISSRLTRRNSANWLMALTCTRESAPSRDQTMLGPKTTAKLDAVILFRQLRSVA